MKGATNWTSWALVVFAWMATLLGGHAQPICGRQVGGKLCRDDLCCSSAGYCGDTQPYCGEGCQSQCVHPPPPPSEPLPPVPPDGGPVGEIISKELFERLLLHRNDPICQGNGFYTYDAFIAAAYHTFPLFGAEGDLETRTREIAAFLGQTSHETTGGWRGAPDGPYAWGYCYVKEARTGCCDERATQWPCVEGKSYCGRGPIQLTYNYNYGPAGKAIGEDLLNDPDKVASDPYVSFETALWFWMTPQPPKPSCHDVIIGKWKPSQDDKENGRKPGFGVLTNIINGGVECGNGTNKMAADRVGYYKYFCEILSVSPGHNLDCDNQKPFGSPPALGGRSVM